MILRQLPRRLVVATLLVLGAGASSCTATQDRAYVRQVHEGLAEAQDHVYAGDLESALAALDRVLAEADLLGGTPLEPQADPPTGTDQARFQLLYSASRIQLRAADAVLDSLPFLRASLENCDRALVIRPQGIQARLHRAVVMQRIGEHSPGEAGREWKDKAVNEARSLVAGATDAATRYDALVALGRLLERDPGHPAGPSSPPEPFIDDPVLLREHQERRGLAAAIAEGYWPAYELQKRNPPIAARTEAAERVLVLEDRLLRDEGDAEHMYGRCVDMERSLGLDATAALGYERLMANAAAGSVGARALVAWVDYRIAEEALSMSALSSLRDYAHGAELQTAIDDLAGMIADPVGGLGRIVASQDGPAPPSLWVRADRNRYVTCLAVRNLAEAITFSARSRVADDAQGRDALSELGEQGTIALEILGTALDELANEIRMRSYGIGGDLHGRRHIALEMSLGLAVMLHRNHVVLDPDRSELWGLLRDEPLVTFSDERSRAFEALRWTRAERYEAHRVLGMILGDISYESRAEHHVALSIDQGRLDQGRLDPDSLELRATRMRERLQSTAILIGFGTAYGLLDQLVAVPRLLVTAQLSGQSSWAGPADTALPSLERRIGYGLIDHTNPADRLYNAARGYNDLGRRDAARSVYERALEHAGITNKRVRDIEYLVYPAEGLYLGASLGLTEGGESGSGFASVLAGFGHDVGVELDDSDVGGKFIIGYRLSSHFAVEGALVGLGDQKSSIADFSGINLPQLKLDVQALHPVSGRGLSLAGVWYPSDPDRRFRHIDPFFRLGLWAWQSDFTIPVSGGGPGVNVKKSSVDPFVGTGVLIRMSPRWDARIGLEHYLLGRDDYDVLWLGLQMRPY